MNDYMLDKEIDEAITSGETALYSLKEAQKKLNSAKNWGIFDMLGGGLVTDIVKHSRMKEASVHMEAAKRDLLVFQKELQDVQGSIDLKVDVGSGLTFADFVFDGIIMDYVVQTKIVEAREQVEHAIAIVQKMVDELKAYYGR